MRKQANVSAIIQSALKDAGQSVDNYNTEKTASVAGSYAVPLAQELHKVASLLRSQSAEADVTLADVQDFAQRLKGSANV